MRLLFALAVSIAFHLGLLAAMAPGAAPRPGAAGAPALDVRLAAAAVIETGPLERKPLAEPAGPPPAPPTPAAETRPPVRRAHSRPEQRDAPPVPAEVDVRYHAAHELDVFPQLVQPVILDRSAIRGTGAAERLRLELFIDASGMVRRVSVLDAGQPESAAAAARMLWQGTRFDPARKLGRAVASRIEIEVTYGPAGALR